MYNNNTNINTVWGGGTGGGGGRFRRKSIGLFKAVILYAVGFQVQAIRD